MIYIYIRSHPHIDVDIDVDTIYTASNRTERAIEDVEKTRESPCIDRK